MKSSSIQYQAINQLMTHLNTVLNSHVFFNTREVHMVGRHCDGFVERGTGKLCGEEIRHVVPDQIIKKLLDDIAALINSGPPPEHMSN